jgi:hypothetical protein
MEPIDRRFSDISDQRRLETGKASAAGTPDAGVDDAQGGVLEQPFGERLRCDVACGIEAVGKGFRAAQVVELAAEVREVIAKAHFIFITTHFGEMHRFEAIRARSDLSLPLSRVSLSSLPAA